MFYKWILFLLSGLCIFSSCESSSLSGPGLFSENSVFRNGTEGYRVFRIPAVIQAANGDLLAFAEGRVNSSSDHGNLDIVMKRSRDGGQSWSPLQVVAENGDHQAGNPGPVVDLLDPVHPGRIWMPYNISSHSEREVMNGTGLREVLVIYSDDHGQSWSEPRNITDQVHQVSQGENWRWYAITPGHAIQLQTGDTRGRLFFPANHSTPDGVYHSHSFYSDDHGTSWQLGGTVGAGTNECQAVELSNGDIMMNMRNYRLHGKRAVSISSDAGESWSEPWDEDQLPEPRCQASIIRYSQNGVDGALKDRILFSNPDNTRSRKGMTVRISYNEGHDWTDSRLIRKGASAYSDLLVRNDGLIGLLYEHGNTGGIFYASFDLEWLSRGKDIPAVTAFKTF